jgi:N-acyl-D-amino-acid deacylase
MRSALFLLCAGALCSRLAAQAPAAYDVVISGGRIVDGSGNPWFYGDVAIAGDRIVRIATPHALDSTAAKLKIDARGMIIAPGFIDIQGQSRGALLTGDGRLISKVTQGITTEIMGEGSTNAPANQRTLAAEPDDSSRAINGHFTGPHGFRDWLEAMQQHGASPNFGSFVGATTLRIYGKGMAQGTPSPAELEEMRGAMKRAMEDGAFGLASALIYPPGEYTTTNELIELAKVMSPYGGVYITHMRSEADRLLEAIDEAIEIGRKGGVPVEIYHLKAAGQANWPKMAQAIAKIDQARRSGLDVGADMYPYVAGGTGLSVCLPPWVSADGKLFDNLKDPAARTKMHSEMLAPARDWENLCQQATPEGVLITQTRSENQQYQGKRLSEIARMMHKDWAEAAMDLIASEHRRVETMFFVASEDNLKLQLRQPWIKFGTDASGLDPSTARGLAHPRSYGNFPRVLGKYVREEHVIALEDAIRKMTSSVANRLSLHDRGSIKEGMFADMVIFDPQTVADRATYEQPHQLSVGIRDVFVNGVAVVRNGEHTGAKPGRIVWGPGRRP